MRRTPRNLRFLLATLLGIGLLFVIVSSASAHAKVDGSNPKANSTLPTAPTTITVTTAEDMKSGAQYSNLFVYGPSGELVSQGDAKVNLNNPKEMSVNIQPEKADGVYVVRWITVSNDDGDPDQGAFIFTVKSGAAAAPTPAPTTGTTTTNGNSNASSGTPVWVPIVTGIAALLVGLLGGFALARTRTTPATPLGTTANVPDPDKTPSRRP